MEERGLVGLVVWTEEGDEMGRISEVITDEESGAITHVMVESDGEQVEVPISAVQPDADADFAVFHADPSDVEPGDHVADEIEPEGYAPSESDVDDYEHDGQFVSEPTDPDAAQPREDLVRESGEAGSWQDEAFEPDSGYPRNDAYIDPDTGETEVDPATEDNETLADGVEDLLVNNGLDGDLEVRSEKDGVIELGGSVGSRENLEGLLEEVMGLDGVLEVDTTDVDVGE